jgi:FtsP/CotA-like multicopper oxidase with cupredoxin domain
VAISDKSDIPVVAQPRLALTMSDMLDRITSRRSFLRSARFAAHVRNSTKQVGLGLLRASIVTPKVKATHDDVGVDEVLILNDGDGQGLEQPWKCDTLNVVPGERWDAIVTCNNPGTWACHCQTLPHAEPEHGMFGMAKALVVQK